MQVLLTLAVAEEDLAKEKIKTQLQQKQHEREVQDLRGQLELKAARAEEERKQAVMPRILARMVQRTKAQALDRWVEVVEEAAVTRAEEQVQMAALGGGTAMHRVCNKLQAQVAELQQTCEQYKHMVQQLQSRVAEMQQTCQAQINVTHNELAADSSKRLSHAFMCAKNTKRFSLLNSVAARMVQMQQYVRQLHHNINELQSGWHESVLASWPPPPGKNGELLRPGHEGAAPDLLPGWVRRASMLRMPPGQGERGSCTTWERMWLGEVDSRHSRCISQLAKVEAACNHCSALLRAKMDLRQLSLAQSQDRSPVSSCHHRWL
jgi:hypothetical protein